MTRTRITDEGFTLVELMTVVVLIGILVATAIPLFISTGATAAEKTCFANQRYLEGVTETWVGSGDGRRTDDLIGVVNGSHILVQELIIGKIPRCPAGADAANPQDPTVAEGAYTYLASGFVTACAHGDLGAHGHY